jgi:hypothetical protein
MQDFDVNIEKNDSSSYSDSENKTKNRMVNPRMSRNEQEAWRIGI